MVKVNGATTSVELREHNRVRLLRAVHDCGADRTRSQLTRDLDLARGTASVLVAGLVSDALLHEEPSAGHTRGRPTQVPGPHPLGPIALAVDLREDRWELAACELGGRALMLASGSHDGTPAGALLPLGRALRTRALEYGPRLIGIGLAAPGPVRSGRLVDIGHLGWRAIDVPAHLASAVSAHSPEAGEPPAPAPRRIAVPQAPEPPEVPGSPVPWIERPRRAAARAPRRAEGVPSLWGVPLHLGNDTACAALAEARRGRMAGIGVGLHIHVDFDLGGLLVVEGRPLGGATGMGAEFGHLPLTGGTRRCVCGALGCWGMDVGANALLRHLGMAAGGGRGRDLAQAILADGARGDAAARESVAANASSLGAGLACLVNAHDPELVTLSGLGADLYQQAPGVLDNAFLNGLMTIRADSPPPLLRSDLGWRGPLLGAMETVFDAFLTPEALRAWNAAP
ncbi:ROK family protein [Nonomuraea longicatena]|uniref:ROK family transcriptional regulator n=1 Tax=Nonomuraea longicatena TaxID=83682 RepID=A0ABN1NQ75_9ACTN